MPSARVDVRDAAAEQRGLRVAVLVAEVELAQAIVDVVAAEVARDALQQVRLFERSRFGLTSVP